MGLKAKTINLLLYDGNLNGVISIQDSSWNSGELYSSPRESVADLLKNGACSKFGVYLLLSDDMVYVGQASDLAKRLSQHLLGKEWWQNAVILTTTDDSLNHSDIDYIEYVLIDKAFAIERLDCDNKKKGNPPKVDKFRKVILDQYLEEALFVMQLIGINVFNEDKKSTHKGLIDVTSVNVKLSLGKRTKTEAIKYASENGVKLASKNTSYAVLRPDKGYFWINPRIKVLESDWNVILNDTANSELVILSVPANTFDDDNKSNMGLKVRKDKPDLLDIKISREKLTDTVSGLSFSKYLQTKIKY
ncbi:MAG: GIY-YIG nuclease family protein [Lachnospiraceae bacterium]|nr:GIY-YIG nuclease family protein [Lachnospiraceae bacterium]